MDDKNIFDILKEDHEQFISVFNSGINFLKVTRNLKIAFYLLDYCTSFLEAYHQDAEESLLFKMVAKNPKIKSGGPQCTYFYDIQMMNNPLLDVYRELDLKDFAIRSEHIPSEFKEEFENKLPIIIPLEEHIAGKLLLNKIYQLLSQDGDIEKILNLFNKYYSIQVFHFKKEENCFFEMCANLISKNDLNSITQQITQKKNLALSNIYSLIDILKLKVPQ